MKRVTRKVFLNSPEEALNLWGKRDEFLRIMEEEFNIKIIGRDKEVSIQGEKDNVDKVFRVINRLLNSIRRGERLEEEDIREISSQVRENREEESLQKIEVYSLRSVRPKNPAQRRYIQAIREKDIVFSIGPAGTGKTYLAMAMAVNFLKEKRVNRVILVRPAVEAGEKLGFLPGNLYEKITPYLRPLYDALYDMMEADRLQQYLERGIIEIAPLAYMRGRTFNDSFIVLDEAQNSTSEQMKMFLTRLGFDSKVVITGDITQVDLPRGTTSGLIEVQDILKGIKGIEFVYFTEKDVVRHPLVQAIVRAYEQRKKK